MAQAADENIATQAANKLLERVFTSLKDVDEAPADGAEALVAAPSIPLYKSADDHGREILSLGGKSLISTENRSGVPAGRYQVMLMDMPSQTESAALALRVSGAVEHVETGKTSTGNGILFCVMNDKPLAPGSRSIIFDGEGGKVEIDWHDCRASRGGSEWQLSVELPRKSTMTWILRAPYQGSGSVPGLMNQATMRARSITKAVSEGLPCDLSASLFQAEFERTVPGARVSFLSVSVQDVIEALEDLTGKCSHVVAFPGTESIRRAIARHLSECTLSSQQIAQSVAMTLIGQNSVRAA